MNKLIPRIEYLRYTHKYGRPLGGAMYASPNIYGYGMDNS